MTQEAMRTIMTLTLVLITILIVGIILYTRLQKGVFS